MTRMNNGDTHNALYNQ